MQHKFDATSTPMIFVGYGDSGEMGYRLRDPKAKKLARSHDVIYLEDIMLKVPINTKEVWHVIFQEDEYVLAPHGVQNVENLVGIDAPLGKQGTCGNMQPKEGILQAEMHENHHW